MRLFRSPGGVNQADFALRLNFAIVSDRIDNLITSCRKCNIAKSSLNLEEFLAKDPERLAHIQQQLKKPMASATHINQLIPLLRKALAETRLSVTETDAVTTAYTRKVLGIPKTRVNDALCLGEPLRVHNVPERVTVISAAGHGKRQMLTWLSKEGTPRNKKRQEAQESLYQAYCRLPREKQGFTTPPGHKLRQKRSQGITSGDLIRYTHEDQGVVQGYATLGNRNSRVKADGKKSVLTRKATLLSRNNGYRLSTTSNT